MLLYKVNGVLSKLGASGVFLLRGLFGVNLGKFQCFLALELVCYIVFAVLSMVVPSILARVVLIHQLWHWSKLYFIAWSIECDN